MPLKTLFLYSLAFLFLNLFVLIGIFLLYHPTPIAIKAAVLTDERLESKSNTLGTSARTENDTSGQKSLIPDPVTILLIGLDNRRGQKSSRCDAIHILTFNRKDKTLRMLNIPRGTPLSIPGFDEKFSIISNACAVSGIEKVKTQIETITQSKIDYTVTVGFSQFMGIARILKLPSMETLTSLRSRAYPTGDNQRSYNQALFLRDLIGKHISSYSSFPKPFKYIAFNMLDTDMDFDTANILLTEASASPFSTDASLISVHSFSPTVTSLKDIHLLDKIETASQDITTSDKETAQYQKNLIAYLQRTIDKSENFLLANRKDQGFNTIQTVFLQQVWLQIEDETMRDDMHFKMLGTYVRLNPDISISSKLLLDFITEMELKGNEELKKEAESLLNTYK